MCFASIGFCDPTYHVNSFAPYPGYAGPLKVAGSAKVVTHECEAGDSRRCQSLGWDLSGLGVGRRLGSGESSVGGIHIHDAESCQACAAKDCDHYYATESVSPDPWTNSTYTASIGGTSLQIPTGDRSKWIGTGLVALSVLGANPGAPPNNQHNSLGVLCELVC